MLTKKEYELIASVVRSLPAPITKGKLAEAFANRLELNNSRFDREKFIRACAGIASVSWKPTEE